MKIEAFLPVDQVEEMECQSAFISLARQLIIAGRMFFYDTPCYHNRDFGLSIVITYVDSRTYNCLESCILAMCYKPIPEAGPTRVVLFRSISEKEAFKLKFSNYYEKTLIDFKEELIYEIDYFRMTSRGNELSAQRRKPHDRNYFMEFNNGKLE